MIAEEYVVQLLKEKTAEACDLSMRLEAERLLRKNETESLRRELERLRADLDWLREHSSLYRNTENGQTWVSFDSLHGDDNPALFLMMSDGRDPREL